MTCKEEPPRYTEAVISICTATTTSRYSESDRATPRWTHTARQRTQRGWTFNNECSTAYHLIGTSVRLHIHTTSLSFIVKVQLVKKLLLPSPRSTYQLNKLEVTVRTRTHYTDNIALVDCHQYKNAARIYEWCIQTKTYLYKGLGSNTDAKHQAHINGYKRVLIHRA